METRQAHQSPPALPPPPVLPDDLTAEILSWLPVKSLLQFRCVCKSWKSTISDPKFVKLHLHRSARNAKLLLMLARKSRDVPRDVFVPCSVRSLLGNPSSIIDEEYCFPLKGDRKSYNVVGSCNGLVCFLGGKYPEYRFFLFNPATNLTLKNCAYLRAGDRCFGYSFLFGYDNLSDTYKVLAFTFRKEKQLKICSLGDTCWRDIHGFPDNPLYKFKHGHDKEVYFNGSFNWLALCNINSAVIAQFVIVSLDMGMETCTQFLLPHLDEALLVDPTIGVLMDFLCFSHDSNRTHFVVWQMKDFGVEKSWIQYMKVSYQDLQIDRLRYSLIPLCTSENGDVLVIKNIGEFQALLYHRRDNRVERTKLPRGIQWFRTLVYVESLVSPWYI